MLIGKYPKLISAASNICGIKSLRPPKDTIKNQTATI